MLDDDIDSTDMLVQFILRMVVLSIALLSTTFIAITCYFSKRMQYWSFKLIFWQSIAESIDLILAIIFSINSIYYPEACSYVAYVMHASWLTSFLCSMAIFLMYYALLKPLKVYESCNKHINVIIVIVFILPYIWLFEPLYLNEFGPSGWKINDELKYFYCGFKDTKNLHFLIFFNLPLGIIIMISLIASFQSKKIVDRFSGQGVETDETKLLSKIKIFPMIYTLSWTFHCLETYFFLGIQLPQNPIAYYVIILTYILFELHILVVAIYFYKCYDPILKIKRIWFCRKVKYVYVQQQDSLIVNPMNLSEE